MTEESRALRDAVVADWQRRAGRWIVALSGGVDSAVLLQLAVEGLGAEEVLAVTGASAAVAPAEVEDARAIAAQIGCSHEILETGEMELPGYRANRGDRCFHCRGELFSGLTRLARERGYDGVAYGAIRDDTGDFRPGMRAAESHGIIAPLLDAGLSKEDVRSIARASGLAVRDKPAEACLSSRIPVGTPVTRERLAQVARAEAALRSCGFGQLRVRHHGEVARLELDAAGLLDLQSASLRREVVAAVRAAGFRFVALDLEGYRTGSLNPPSAAQDEG